MATRHATTLTGGRHVAQLYHHECRGLHPSLSMLKQKRGYSGFRRLPLSPVKLPHYVPPSLAPSPAAALAPYDPEFERLRAEMLARPEQLTYDALSNIPSYLFDISLSEYLDGDNGSNTKSKARSYNYKNQPQDLNHHPFPNYDILPQGHHLIHFPPALSPSGLCPDGTDPYHSPGEPFTRRMWAGGSIEFPNVLRQNATPAVCAERIQDVTIRGTPGNEKIFVDVLRRYGEAAQMRGEGDRGPFELCGREAVREVRTLVFMRKQDVEESVSAPGSKSERLIKVPYHPTHTHALIPDRTLLFHFSALSYNAHLIHLDERYAQDVEGRPALLVHGPLCLNLMLEVLRRSVRKPRRPGESDEEAAACPRELTVNRIDYRNLAPLYADQKMTVCVRSPPPKEGLGEGEAVQQKHDVWIENQHGGLCVKGTVVATERSMSSMERFHTSFAKRMNNGEFDG